MIQLDPDLSRVARVMPSGKRIIGLSKNVIYRALAADGKTANGLSPILVILDELGQVKGPTDDFVSALTSAQGAYENPLLIVISTQAPTDADMLSTMIDAQRENPDPHVVCHVYEAPVECRLDDEEAWKAANPGLGVFRSIDDVRKQCSAAMAMPANEPAFRNLILNQRVEASAPFVSRSVWESNGDSAGIADGKRVWCGLDLSTTHHVGNERPGKPVQRTDFFLLNLPAHGNFIVCSFKFQPRGNLMLQLSLWAPPPAALHPGD